MVPPHRGERLPTCLQNVISDDLSKNLDIHRACELKPDLAEPAEPHLKFTVPVEPAGGLDGPCLDLGVGQGRVVGLLAREALDVDGDDALACEVNGVPRPLKLRYTSSPWMSMFITSSPACDGLSLTMVLFAKSIIGSSLVGGSSAVRLSLGRKPNGVACN